MWKLIVGFIAFAGLALWVMMNSAPVDIGGEHAAQEAMHKDAPPAASASAAPAAAVPATPRAAPIAPAGGEAKP